ncbi:hypothetical protein [Ferrimicrobium sp.]|uniref:hypothetical protein n=1 Tax=Ferrimicrobium sp. TaxID=2926050 RepID=UPI002615D644|nr:hypothetical protein [Ferrimicrobium sp.]
MPTLEAITEAPVAIQETGVVRRRREEECSAPFARIQVGSTDLMRAPLSSWRAMSYQCWLELLSR